LPSLVRDGAKRRRGPERRDIVFGKNKGRDRLKIEARRRSRSASAVRRGRLNSAGFGRTKMASVAAKLLISLEPAKENIWNFLGKSLEKLGFSLEKF
jgi:hypothetical protein